MVTIWKILSKAPAPAKGKPGNASRPDAIIHQGGHECALLFLHASSQHPVSIQPVLTGASPPIFPVVINATLKIISIRPGTATIAPEWLYTLE